MTVVQQKVIEDIKNDQSQLVLIVLVAGTAHITHDECSQNVFISIVKHLVARKILIKLFIEHLNLLFAFW